MTEFEKIENAIKAGGRVKGDGYDTFIYDTLDLMEITIYKEVRTNYFSSEIVETTFSFDCKGNLKEIY